MPVPHPERVQLVTTASAELNSKLQIEANKRRLTKARLVTLILEAALYEDNLLAVLQDEGAEHEGPQRGPQARETVKAVHRPINRNSVVQSHNPDRTLKSNVVQKRKHKLPPRHYEYKRDMYADLAAAAAVTASLPTEPEAPAAQ